MREQRVMGGEGQVVDIYLVGQTLTASSTDGHKQAASFTRRSRQQCLCLGVVAGVNYRVDATGQNLRPVFRRDEIIDAVDMALFVDVGDALAHGQHLGLPHGRVKCMDLPVDIGFTDVVKICLLYTSDAADE